MFDFFGFFDVEFVDGQMHTLELNGAVWSHSGFVMCLIDVNGTRYNYNNVISFRAHEGAK